MDLILSTESDVDNDDEGREIPRRKMCQIQTQIPQISDGSNDLNHGSFDNASNQIAQVTSIFLAVENNGKRTPYETASRTRDGQRSGPPKVPRMLRELGIDNAVRTPSPCTRGSKRCAKGSQPPPNVKRGCVIRSLEDEDGDEGEDECKDGDHLDEHGVKDDEARVKRSSTRNSAAIYDMKFHPMDRATRPHATATQRVLAKEIEIGETIDDDDKKAERTSGTASSSMETRRSVRSSRGKHRHPFNSSHQLPRSLRYSKTPSTKPVAKNIASKTAVIKKKMNPSTPDDENLLKALIGVDFDGMCSMDRILHNIQHGAPIDSTPLPHSWAKVADVLIQEGFFTENQYKAWGGVTVLKRRYNGVRYAVQGKSAELEPKNKKDQKLYWAEGMDVLDLVGSRTIYIHKGIPEYMKGIEEFTQNDLDQKKKEFLESADEATIVVDSEPSRTSSPVTESIVSNTRTTTGVSLKGEVTPQIPNKPRSEIGDTPVHSEDFSLVEEEHLGQEAAADILLSATESTASIAAHNGPSPVSEFMPASEQNGLEARSIDATLAFVRSTQSPSVSMSDTSSEQHVNTTNIDVTIQTSKKKRSKKSKSSNKGFAIHEDSSGFTPKVPEDSQLGLPNQEDPKENVVEEDDSVEAAELVETDSVSNSQIAASEGISSTHRLISPTRGAEIFDTPLRRARTLSPNLPLHNPLRTEISPLGAQSTRTPRTSSTLTS
ncbi:hypothetical protein MMC18_003778 [Xylographa bjoerkii]|nr:hypothetical protein [Xylographa bjoerkii]